MKNTKSLMMKQLFKQLGYDIEDLDPGTIIDISDQNIKIKSFNHESKKDEFKKILFLLRKEDSFAYKVLDKNGNQLFKGSKNHKIYDTIKNCYVSLEMAKEAIIQKNENETCIATIEKTKEIIPFLDIEVEDNQNYYTNGVLSHNTTTGGNALKFYASQRIDIRRIAFIKDGEAIIGNKIRVKCVKNKCSSPFKFAELQIMYGEGISKEHDLLNLAVESGFVEKAGSWFKYKGESIGQGEQKIVDLLKENKELYTEIESKVRAYFLNGEIPLEDTSVE